MSLKNESDTQSLKSADFLGVLSELYRSAPSERSSKNETETD